MNTDKQVFTATQKTAKTLKTYRDKSDEELLAFLAKQDSLTLNQLKVYYSDPSFASLFHQCSIFQYNIGFVHNCNSFWSSRFDNPFRFRHLHYNISRHICGGYLLGA